MKAPKRYAQNSNVQAPLSGSSSRLGLGSGWEVIVVDDTTSPMKQIWIKRKISFLMVW